MDCTVSTGAAAMMAVRVLLVRGWVLRRAGGSLPSNVQNTSLSQAEGLCAEKLGLAKEGVTGDDTS